MTSCARARFIAMLLVCAACGESPASAPLVERCNGADDDGDGTVDEGCACVLGATSTCCGGAGTQTCGDFGAGPVWTECSFACGPTDAASEDASIDAGSDDAGLDASTGDASDAALAPDDAGSSCTPSTEVCNGVDDDCDDAIDEDVRILCVPDVDGDLRAGSTTTTSVCPVASRPAAGSCPAGMVAPTSSLGPDCDDGSEALYTSAVVRADADTDGYCAGPATTQCIGVTPPDGTRLAPTCAETDDCRDANALAATVCVLPGGYTTTSATKGCLGVPTTQTFTVSPTATCPLGFALSAYEAIHVSGTGSCTAVSTTMIQMTCNGLDGAVCSIVGVCVAL